MNLGQQIAKILLEQDRKTIAIFPGAFKPPHKGHVEVIKKLLQTADEVVVLISPILRDGISADESLAVWELYKPLFNGPVELKISDGSPIKATYEIVKNNPDTEFIVAFGKGEAERFKHMVKFPNVKVYDGGYIQDVNATNLRNSINSKDEPAIEKYLPKEISVVDFLNAIGDKTARGPQGPQEEPLAEAADPLTNKYHKLVQSELGEIDRTSEVFNVHADDLQYAFETGQEVVLSDDVWSKLENSDSYNISSLEQAIKIAIKNKKNWKDIIYAIKNEEQLPPPMVLEYDQSNKYYLVSGNTRLMIYRALGLQPIVLMANLNLTVNEESNVFDVDTIKLNEEQTSTIGEFVKYSIKNLGLQNLPSSLTLSYNNDRAKEMHSFGCFDPNTKKIWVYVKNRNMADILRTLAHELVHRRQEEQGRLDPTSGQTGSPIEDEANAMAGVLLRNFGKINNNIYENKK
jgi:cytidyltransferase-like protein